MSLSRAPAAADILVEQKKSRKLFFKDRKMMEGSGKLLEDIDVASGREVEEVIRISNSKFVASYNWKDSDEPIIFVPGKRSLGWKLFTGTNVVDRFAGKMEPSDSAVSSCERQWHIVHRPKQPP